MKFVNYRVPVKKDEFVEMLSSNEKVNKNVIFEEKKGKPYIHLKEKGNLIKLSCEYIGGAGKDNELLGGTRFFGKIKEYEDYSHIKGVIVTAPIFHSLMFLMFSIFVVMCIINQAFNVVPICLIIFDIVIYKDEFKKQGIIERYIRRAIKRLSKTS